MQNIVIYSNNNAETLKNTLLNADEVNVRVEAVDTIKEYTKIKNI